jgi:hypothetical protein
LWAVIKRNINGSDARYLERIKPRFTGNDANDATDAFFVDSGLTYDGRVEISSINPEINTVTTSINHGFINNDVIRFRVSDDPDADEGDEGSLNYQQFVVSDKTDTTFTCKDWDGNYIGFSDYTAIDYDKTNTVAKNVTTISGLDHLEGETVSVLVDGSPDQDYEVSDGSIELADGASVVHAGLSYESDLETLNPEIQLKTSPTAQGTTKRITTVVLRLRKTLGCKIGPDEDNLKTLDFASDQIPMDHSPELFSGDYEHTFNGTYDSEANIYIRQDQPLPFMLLALIPDIEFNEGE